MCLLLDFSFPMVIAEVDGSTKQEVAIDDEGTDTSKKADEQEGVVKRRKILPLKEARVRLPSPFDAVLDCFPFPYGIYCQE